MKVSVASPSTGTQKIYEIEEEKRLSHLIDKKIGAEFDAGIISDQFKGYTFKITGGCDKQGFPMKQGILTNSRVRIMIKRGDLGFRAFRGRKGEKRRKSVRGCLFGLDLAILHTTITKEGENKLEGLNDHVVPRKLGPKKASKIRKLFNLTKEDDVRKYVIKRVIPSRKEGGKPKIRRPKIQRLITPTVLARRKRKAARILAARAKYFEERCEYQARLDRKRILSAQRKRSRALLLQKKQKVKENKRIKTKAKKHAKKAEFEKRAAAAAPKSKPKAAPAKAAPAKAAAKSAAPAAPKKAAAAKK